MKILVLLFSLIFVTVNAKPFTVMLDWFTNPNHAPIFVAQQQGYFKALGLNVKILTPSNPNDVPKMVASRHVDVGLDYQPNVILQRAHGLPIKQIGVLIATPLTSIITLDKSHISSLQQLKGKTIAGSSNDLVSKAMLRANGLKPSQYKMIDVGYSLVQALLSGHVDAASGVDRNVELIVLHKMGQHVHVFYPEDNGVPIYDGLVYITNSSEARNPQLKKFMQAVSQAVIYLINHPQQCWNKFAQNHPALNNNTVRAEWFATLPRFALRPRAIDRQRIANYKLFMRENGQLKDDNNN